MKNQSSPLHLTATPSLRDRVYLGKDHLILSPAHAVYVGADKAQTADVHSWKGAWVEGYRENDEASLYVTQVKTAVQVAAESPNSLLIPSGGQTREIAGPRSEALGLFCVCEQHDYFGHLFVRDRIVLEEWATDSFLNLAFGLYRFRQCTGNFPREVSIVGFGFKEERYFFHKKTLESDAKFGIPPFTMHYISAIQPPYYRLYGEGGSIEGERKTLEQFKACPRGNSGELLVKRLDRDPFCRGYPPYNLPAELLGKLQ